MAHKFGKNKQSILMRLSQSKTMLPKSALLKGVVPNTEWIPVFEKAILSCKNERLIDCNDKDEYYITDAGLNILKALAER